MKSSLLEANSDRWRGVLARERVGENHAVIWRRWTSSSFTCREQILREAPTSKSVMSTREVRVHDKKRRLKSRRRCFSATSDADITGSGAEEVALN